MNESGILLNSHIGKRNSKDTVDNSCNLLKLNFFKHINKKRSRPSGSIQKHESVGTLDSKKINYFTQNMKNSEDPILFKSRNSPASKEQNWTAKFLKSHHSKQKLQLRQNNSFRSKKNPLSTFSGIHQLSTIPPFHQTFAKTSHPKSPSDSAQESNSGENPQDTDTINCGSDTNDNIPLLHTKKTLKSLSQAPNSVIPADPTPDSSQKSTQNPTETSKKRSSVTTASQNQSPGTCARKEMEGNNRNKGGIGVDRTVRLEEEEFEGRGVGLKMNVGGERGKDEGLGNQRRAVGSKKIRVLNKRVEDKCDGGGARCVRDRRV